MLCIKNGLVYDGICQEAKRMDILVEDGKIVMQKERIDVVKNTQIIMPECQPPRNYGKCCLRQETIKKRKKPPKKMF